MSAGACPTFVTFKNLKFLLCVKPNTFYIPQYIKDLKLWGVKTLVRVCEQQYDLKPFRNSEIEVIELTFPDGEFPPPLVIESWIGIVRDHVRKYPHLPLGVHCRCGLGRSAVLVAVALMEGGLSPLRAVQIVRRTRRGAFNKTQVEKICQYDASKRLLCTEDTDFRCHFNKRHVLF